MPALVRAALAAAVLLVTGVASLTLLLPRIVRSDAVRHRIETAARQALEREVRYADLEVGLLPPSLIVVAPSVAGQTPQEAPLLEAVSVELRIAFAPLLARLVVIDSLMIEGARLRLLRTPDGFELPLLADREGGSDRAPEEEAGGLAFAIRGLELRDATLVFVDRSLSPAVTTEISHVNARARGDSLEQPIAVELELGAGGRGRLSGRGSATLDGQLDAEFELDELPVTPLAPYLATASELAGTLSGKVSVRGDIRNPDPVAVDLELSDGSIRLERFALRGAVAVQAAISGGLRAPTLRFELDATGAELHHGEVFTKPPGMPATVRGRVAKSADGGLDVDDLYLGIQNTEARGEMQLGERTRVALDAPSVELSGWHPLVAALGDYELSGPVAAQGIELLTNPLEIRGKVHLDGVQIRVPDGEPVELRGELLGEGDAIRADDLSFTAGGQVIPVEGEITDLGGSWRYRFRLRAEQADANRLVSSFSSQDDRLHGPLDLDGDLSGTLAGERSFGEALAGSVRFDIRPGELRGVSMLEAVFRRFEPVGAVGGLLRRIPVVGSQGLLGRRLERFYGDDFDSLSGSLEIHGGEARTEDLSLVTPFYQVELRGLIRFADLGLDAAGQLVLGRELTAAIAGGIGLQVLPDLAKLVIPLPSVRGTLTDPKPEPDWKLFWRALTGNLPGSRAAERLLRGAGGALRGP